MAHPKKLKNRVKLLSAGVVPSIKCLLTDVVKILFRFPYLIHHNFLALLSGVLDMNLKGNLNQITIPDKFE